MKRLIHLTTVLSITAIAIVAVGCSPAPTVMPSPTPIPPTDTAPPTDTPLPTATPPPTSTPTPEPTPTETSTPTPVPTPTVVKKAVEICLVLEDGKSAKGAYLAVMDVDYAQVIPNDGSTGITVTSNNGCRTVKLSPGSYHAIAQKVMSVSEYISGQTDFDVTLESSPQVTIILTGN